MAKELSKFIELIDAIHNESKRIEEISHVRSGDNLAQFIPETNQRALRINGICTQFKLLEDDFNKAIDKIIK